MSLVGYPVTHMGSTNDDVRRHPQFSLSRAARRWFRDSIRYRGIWRTGKELAVRGFEFLRDLTPSRRRLRYGDLQYDFDNRVDTTWSNVQLATRVREIFSGEQYQPIEPEQFHVILDELSLDHTRFTFIDLGSGKGRAVLLASEYPFRRIIGVEILPELHRVAQQNLLRFPAERQRCTSVEFWCGDARDFEFPAEPTVLYLFNPFFEPVLEQVLQNLKTSLDRDPRTLLLVYVNPISEHIVTAENFLNKVGGNHQYSLYVSDGQ